VTHIGSLVNAVDFSMVFLSLISGNSPLAIACRAVRYEVRAEAPLGARYCRRPVRQYLGC
jgi:hypothetical protein